MNIVRRLIGSALWSCLLGVASLCWKIRFIIGSQWAFFSGTTVLGPLTGRYMGRYGLLMMFFIRSLYCMWHNSPVSPLQFLSVYHIPTVCAALYWSFQERLTPLGISWPSRFLRIGAAAFPVACMIAFGCHPVGGQAMWYTLWWSIPVLSLLVPHTNLWVHALASTLVAHAAGSVIWIWAHPAMTAGMWMALVPVVLYERVLIASIMWSVMRLVDQLRDSKIQQTLNAQGTAHESTTVF